ncbi:MAG: DMT family transporter [Oligoflexus sp.]|nr:DMT family transporter [Oligoflexus sp.]
MAVSILLLVIGMLSIQFGATMAKHMFDTVHPATITMVRAGFGAFFLLACFRPWREPMQVGAWPKVIVYGGVLGIMNLVFYLALKRIPLGIAVALEFIGPLGVALIGSRRLIDLLWVFLAAVGIYLIAPIDGVNGALDPVGIALALAAGLCWGLYIIFGKRIGDVASTRQAAAWGMVVAALVVLPFGLYKMNAEVMASRDFWTRAIVVGVLSSAVPYTLEMIVLKRMDSKTFGTLMSIEPALAATMGLVFLHEVLSSTQILAMFAIVSACLGATLTAPTSKDVTLDGVG